MASTAFATSRPLDRTSSRPRRSAIRGRLSWPGRSRCRAPRRSRRPQTLGLNTIGDLLEHLPRDRREARAVAELVAGESATIVVAGPHDLLAPGAPARDAAAGRGDGRRRQRLGEGRVLQPAVARAALPGRNAARAARQAPGAQPILGPGSRTDRRGRRRGRRGRALPGHRGPVLDPDPRARARARATLIEVVPEPLAGRLCAQASVCPTARTR